MGPGEGWPPERTPTDPELGLDEVADELYALHPNAFAAARDERVRRARAAGRKPLAGEPPRLRRPTPIAWVVNQLWRVQRGVA